MDQRMITLNSDLNAIPRCPKCNLIPSFTLKYEEENAFIAYECENNHKDIMTLRDYLNNFEEYSRKNKKCEGSDKTGNNIINNDRFDSLCTIHSNTFCFYCFECKKNICIFCKNEHETHQLIDLSKFNFSKQEKEDIAKDIKNFEIIINDLVDLKQIISTLIEDLKTSSELEMKFIKILLDTYEKEEKMNNINYNIIQNLKSFKKYFKLKKIDNLEKIYKEGKKFISFIKGAKNIQIETFKNNFKTIKNHSGNILYLLKLRDGRLASSSGDNSLNIYNKDTFELEISIKEHQYGIPSFTEINNNRIITCSDDSSMKLIKIEKNKYQVEQVIGDHKKNVRKIIEIKDNIFVSISYDITMKVWEYKDKRLTIKKNINFQNKESYCNILKINNKEFVTYSGGDKFIKFWNSDNYSNIAIINDVDAYWTLKSLCILDNNILCVAGDNSRGFYLISISDHQLIKKIKGPKCITSMSKCLNGLLLCSIIDEKDNNSLVKYDFNNFNLEKISEKEKAHNSNIYSVVELDDDIVASGGEGKQIKLWKY